MVQEESGYIVHCQGFKSKICSPYGTLSWIPIGTGTRIACSPTTVDPGVTLKEECSFDVRLKEIVETPSYFPLLVPGLLVHV